MHRFTSTQKYYILYILYKPCTHSLQLKNTTYYIYYIKTMHRFTSTQKYYILYILYKNHAPVHFNSKILHTIYII